MISGLHFNDGDIDSASSCYVCDSSRSSTDWSPAADGIACRQLDGGAASCCNTVCVDTQGDSANCGVCGRDCTPAGPPATAVCQLGRCNVTLAAGGAQGPGISAIDADNLYTWSGDGPNNFAVGLTPKLGGSLRCVDTNCDIPEAYGNIPWMDTYGGNVELALTGTGTCAGRFDLQSVADGGVMHVPPAGGLCIALATANSSAFFFSDHTAIQSLPRGSASVSTLVADAGGSVATMIADDGNVYFFNSTTGEISRVPVDGSSGPVRLVTGQSGVCSMAVDQGKLFFITGCNVNSFEGLYVVSADAGGPPSPLTNQIVGPQSLALYGGYAYAYVCAGSMLRIPETGGPLEVISYSCANQLHIDATGIYGVGQGSQGSGAAFRVWPP